MRGTSSDSSIGRGAQVWRSPAVIAVTMLLIVVVAVPILLSSERASALPAGFQESTVISGLDDPMAVRFSPDGRVFIGEKSGVIKVYDSVTDPTPDRLRRPQRQRLQLLGPRPDVDRARPAVPHQPVRLRALRLRPRAGLDRPGAALGTPGVYSDNCPTPPGPTADGCVVSGRLSRLRASGNTMTGAEQVLVEDWCQQFQSHSMGGLAFGADGSLYATAGIRRTRDGSTTASSANPLNPCGDPPVPVGGTQTKPTAEGGALRSQDLRTPADPVTLGGSLIRIDPTTGQGRPDNPLASSNDVNARRIVGYGLRNSFRIATRPGTNEVWWGDVGWGAWEEVNRLPAGGAVRNYGWPCYEGNDRQPTWDGQNLNLCEDLYAAGAAAVTAPYFTYQHERRSSRTSSVRTAARRRPASRSTTAAPIRPATTAHCSSPTTAASASG